MKYVLFIGRYNEQGRFMCNQWKGLFSYLGKNVDSINFYSFNKNEVEDNQIAEKYNYLSSIDESNSLYGYQIVYINKDTLDAIKNYQYSIDGGIQFLYFFRENSILAEMQIENWNNFVILYLDPKEVVSLKKAIISMGVNNNKACQKYFSEISDMINGEWRAL